MDVDEVQRVSPEKRKDPEQPVSPTEMVTLHKVLTALSVQLSDANTSRAPAIVEGGERGFIKIGEGGEDDKIEEETQKEVPTKPGGQDVLVLKFKEGMFIN